jgi:hypothetical protein
MERRKNSLFDKDASDESIIYKDGDENLSRIIEVESRFEEEKRSFVTTCSSQFDYSTFS